jgi:V/A-type H+-transporting ATPase subunit A
MNNNVSREWNTLRAEAMRILQEEAELEEIVRLVGVDSLSFGEKLTLEVAKSIREDYLHQNAFHDVDTYTSLNKQYKMLKLIMSFYNKGKSALLDGADVSEIFRLPVREKIGRMKYSSEDEIDTVFTQIDKELSEQLDAIVSKEVERHA